MKAISIKEPWSSMIMSGEKTIETRTWKTKYRGPLLLCCSKNPKSNISGMAFAICNLVNVKTMSSQYDEEKACCEKYEGAYSWFLEDIKPLKNLIPIKGQLRIFDVNIKI